VTPRLAQSRQSTEVGRYASVRASPLPGVEAEARLADQLYDEIVGARERLLAGTTDR
jgi:hypothetical protein